LLAPLRSASPVPAARVRVQATEIELQAAMNPQEERPTPRGNVADARRTFTAPATKSGTGATFAWRMSFSNMSGPVNAAHIHTGERGQAGPVVVPLCAQCPNGASERAEVNAAVLSALQAGRAYVNVHTRRNPRGEVRRGQIRALALTIT
jgi:hypothetical protein